MYSQRMKTSFNKLSSVPSIGPGAAAFCGRDASRSLVDCPRHGRDGGAVFNPERIGALSPAVAESARLPWVGPDRILFNPERVAAPVMVARHDATLAGLNDGARSSQGSSQARNPGLIDGIPSGFPNRYQPISL